mmetsp:Transcript_8357/g.12987  ORF Transcript_8357/g.12987 Transcript_8357/m.12987 type:complete len:264 (+) Transcript_8357:39-830(+)
MHLVQHRQRACLVIDMRCHVPVDATRVLGRQHRQLMKVSGKQRKRVLLRNEFLRNGVRNAKAIVRRSAAPQLVDDDERVLSGRLQNVRRLEHLGHKCRNAAQLIIASANSRQDRVHNAAFVAIARHIAAHLRHQHQHANHSYIGGLPAHVWSRNHLKCRLRFNHVDIVGHYTTIHEYLLQARMARILHHNLSRTMRAHQLGQCPRRVGVCRAMRQTQQHINLAKHELRVLNHTDISFRNLKQFGQNTCLSLHIFPLRLAHLFR